MYDDDYESHHLEMMSCFSGFDDEVDEDDEDQSIEMDTFSLEDNEEDDIWD